MSIGAKKKNQNKDSKKKYTLSSPDIKGGHFSVKRDSYTVSDTFRDKNSGIIKNKRKANLIDRKTKTTAKMMTTSKDETVAIANYYLKKYNKTFKNLAK